MKFQKLSSLIALVAVTLFPIPASLAAQDDAAPAKKAQHHHYKLVVIGTFGGPNSYPFSEDAKALSNRGVAVGQADTAIPDPNYGNFNPYVGQNPYLQHAFKWQDGTLTDLGALPGPNTSNAGWITESGQVSGLSTRSTLDPLTGWPEEAAILWKDGQMIDLGTLGGYEAQADANNGRSQVAGFAANAVPDSFPSPICGCSILPSYGTQQRAFLWEDGVMQDLGTLGGPDAAALLINEQGQVAGESYTSSVPNSATGVPTVDPFLWENGKMVDLGGLGGTFGGAGWLNNRGQVVGSSNLPGDAAAHPFLWDQGVLTDLGTLGGCCGGAIHANDEGEVVGLANNQGDQATLGFLWKNGVMTSLGALDGDQCSLGEHINSKSQIVGISSPHCTFSPGDGHAFLWENGGPMIDLNIFVPSGVDISLFEPGYINDRGEIIGKGPLSNGDIRAFVLIPCDDDHQNVEGCDYSMVDADTAPTAGTPSPVTKVPSPFTQGNPAFRGAANLMLRRFGPRFGPWSRGMGAETPAVKPTSASPGGMTTRRTTEGAPGQPPSCSGGSDGQSGAKPAEPGATDSGNWTLLRGYCRRNLDILDGYCIGNNFHLFPSCFLKTDRQQCPTGAKAIRPGAVGLGLLCRPELVDLARPCSFLH